MDDEMNIFPNENNNEPGIEPEAPVTEKTEEVFEDVSSFSQDAEDINYGADAAASEEQADVTENTAEAVSEEYNAPVTENPIYTQSSEPENSGEYKTPFVYAERVNNGSANPYGNTQSTYQNPYSGMASNNPQFSQNNPAGNDKNDDKKGVKVLASAVVLILVFALGVGCATIFSDRKKGSAANGERTTGDTVTLEIADTPTSKADSGKKDGKVLTAAEIAEKVRNWNVGVVVYSGNSSSASGQGSGIVMSRDSSGKYTYILTCAHVIDDAGMKFKIQTEEGKTYDAQIVGYDIRTDVGVLKVKTAELEIAEFGSSDALIIGDPVYAIGNPGGVEFFGSFTGGYISAINRPVSSEIGYTMKCIQHDAAINPGNSGGMLVNCYGQVVGINSQKIASTEYEGMSFAVPISSAKKIIDDLIAYSYVPDRPKLGISYYPVSASTQYSMIAQIKGLPAGTLIINEINPDSSLAGTDARKYDMIIAVNGKELTTADVLLELIDKGSVGDKLTLTLCRVNSDYSLDEFDVDVTLVEDKGTTETTTTQPYIDPFDYFYGFGN